MAEAAARRRKRRKRRGAYRALLEQWLEVDAGEIIPGASSFPAPNLVRA